jgi:hypothetical protein
MGTWERRNGLAFMAEMLGIYKGTFESGEGIEDNGNGRVWLYCHFGLSAFCLLVFLLGFGFPFSLITSASPLPANAPFASLLYSI